jgi:PAS domain S-box-containing protein
LSRRGCLIRIIRNSRGQYLQANNGSEALEILKRSAPKLILLDAMMPGMDGFETCQHVRALESSKQVPIIFMTTLDDQASIERTFKAGASDYVVKPIHWPVLNARIGNLLKSHQAEHRFQALAESATDGIITIDSQGIIQYTNPVTEKFFGYLAEEIMGQDLSILIPEKFKELHLVGIQRYLETRQPRVIGKTVELQGLRKSGEIFPMELSLSVTEIGEDTSFTGIIRDISVRRQTEIAVRESQARYEHIFQNAGVAIKVEDFSQVKAAIDGLKAQGIENFLSYFNENPDFISQAAQLVRICAVNQTALDLFGARDKVDLLKNLAAVFVPETLEIFQEELLAIANSERYFEAETINCTLGGERINVFVTMVFPEDSDPFDDVLVSVTNITERVRLEQETKTRAELMGQLAHIGETLNKPFTKAEVVETIGQSGMLLSGVTRAAIYLRTPNDEVACPWSQNISPEFKEKMVSQFRDMPGWQKFNQTEPILIPDINALPDDLPVSQQAKLEEYRAVAIWPLVYEDQVIAAFVGYYDQPYAWTQAEREVLLAFARQAAVALENTRLIQNEKRRHDELTRLYRASETLLSSTQPDLAELSQSIVDTVLREFDQSNCSLILINSGQNELERIAMAGSYVEVLSQGQLSLDGSGLVPIAIQTGQIINVSDVNVNPDYLPNWAEAAAEIAIPLKIGDRVIGVIDLQSTENEAFNLDDERLLSNFADRAALALMNAQLFAETRGQSLEMSSLNEQLQTLNINLEDRVRQRTYELQVLHELSQEISYTLDYEELFHRMLTHLHRIVDYDVAMSLLFVGNQPRLYQRMNRNLLPGARDRILTQLQSTYERMHLGQPVTWDELVIHTLDPMTRLQEENHHQDETPIHDLSSVFQVPLIMRSNRQMIGLLFVGAEKEAAFSEGSVRLLYTLATQASISLERLRSLMDVEQQRLESLVEQIPEGIILLNKNKKVVLENPTGKGYLDRLVDEFGRLVLKNLGGRKIKTFLQPRKDGLPHEITVNSGQHQVFEVDSRPIESGPETGGWVLTLRDVTWERDLLAAEKTRRREVDALYGLSREMAATDNLDDILQSIVRQSVESLHITFCRVLLMQDGAFRCMAVFPIRLFDDDLGENQLDDELIWPVYLEVLNENKPFMIVDDHPTLPDEVCQALTRGIAQFICLVPLRVGDEPIGILALGEARDANREPFEDDKLRLASTIGDQSASAIHRALLNLQTRQRLNRLAALRRIDQTITSSVDLNMTLSILLDQIRNELNIDAVNILLFNQYVHSLEFAGSIGFRTKSIENFSIRLGEGFAGKAAMDRQNIYISDLAAENLDPAYVRALIGEGFQVYFGIPLIAKGQIKGVLEVYHRQPLSPDAEWFDFLETLAGQTAIAIDSSEMFQNLQRSNMDLMLAYDATIEGWARALEYRDMETEGHSQRVTQMTVTLAQAMKINDREIIHIRRGALLHDIGKMGVPDNILSKPGKLTDDEWVIMRQHPDFAFNMLAPIGFLQSALDIPHYHHERWDGTGYPKGLKGSGIPLPARIFAIIDVWDALSSDRPYRKAWSNEKVMEHLLNGSGSHFDPQVVDAFIRIIERDNGLVPNI